MKLYYGNGNCSIEGNVSSIDIYYHGNMLITSLVPDGYYIKILPNQLCIDTILNKHNLNELFSYTGELKIYNLKAKNLEGGRVYSMSIKRNMDYSEILNTLAEDMTRKSEDIKVTYMHGLRYANTRVLPKTYEGLHTTTISKDLLLNNEIYTGHFHLHADGMIMTGASHTKDSKILGLK